MNADEQTESTEADNVDRSMRPIKSALQEVSDAMYSIRNSWAEYCRLNSMGNQVYQDGLRLIRRAREEVEGLDDSLYAVVILHAGLDPR